MSDSLRIGVSACLAGEKVRYDRSHHHDRYLTETLAKYVEFIPLCPEIACGMGIPREKLRQVDCAGTTRLIGYESGDDLTDTMTKWADRVLPGLDDEELCGFVVKPKSPSCGVKRAKIFSTTGTPPKRGTGFFTKLLMQHAPLLPVVNSEQLHNPLLRENFIRRIFVLKRWRKLTAQGQDIGKLVDFHTRHKMLIRAHDLKGYRELGKLLGQSSQSNVKEVFAKYATMLFSSLQLQATPKKNSDVLQHAMGYFKKNIDAEDKQELLDMITAYRKGKIPLLMPITLLNHFARKYQKPYLIQQFFLNPAPAELQLLNQV